MLQVLLVEDNPADALLVEVAMEEMARPPRLVHVSRLSEALDLLAGSPVQPAGGGFDVVFLDLGLPDSQGLNSFARVQQVAPDVPLIALTGLSDEQAALEALQSGASDYLIKGQTEASLLERSMRYAIERKKSERARIELARAHAEREEAESTNRAKDEFLATLSHELRTPLNAILGWASLLRSQTVEPALLQTAFDTIERNARTQAQLVDDLLDVSRIITGKLSLDHHVLNFNEVISNAVASLRPQAEAKGLRIERLHDAPLFVCGDAVRLQQVVGNLLSNAIKFTPQDGGIAIGARQIEEPAEEPAEDTAPQVLEDALEGTGTASEALSEVPAVSGRTSWIELEVRDSGQGISPEFLPRVFNRFWQADGSTTRRHGGLGIGLAIVRHLVQAHDGTISVDSPGLGQGSTFRVRLPAMSSADTGLECRIGSQASIGGAMSSTMLSGLRVLGIDDQPDARYLIRVALASCGATVKLASSAHEALELVKSWRPDIIVSDVGMPDMDGYEFLRCVRALPGSEGGQTPSVALTGYARDEERSRAVAAGYEGFLSKPVEPSSLARTVAQIAGR